MTLTGKKYVIDLITDISGFILTTVYNLVSDLCVSVNKYKATNEAVLSQVVYLCSNGLSSGIK